MQVDQSLEQERQRLRGNAAAPPGSTDLLGLCSPNNYDRHLPYRTQSRCLDFLRQSVHGWYWRCWSFRLNEQSLRWNAAVVFFEQRVETDLYANRIRSKDVTVHKGVCLFRVSTAVNLKLHAVPVRISIVD